jgi:hypothetical protein
MNSAALPPFDVVAAALRTTTERLVGEVVQPQESAPDWDEFHWAVARAVCAMQGISALLANRLRWRGPAAWETFLAEQAAESLARDEHIGVLLARLDEATRAAELGVLALKGSALREMKLYAPGERPQGDIDLLVDAGDMPRITRVLESLDYRCACNLRRHAVFEPRLKMHGPAFGEHRANPLKIEVHTCIAEPLPVTPVDITARLVPAQWVPGINPYRDDTALLLHLALHAAGNMRAHALRFLQLHDIAQLAPRLGAQAWEQPDSWWLAAPLSLVARYHPGLLGDELLDALWRRAPRPLRRALAHQSVTDVSWSNLRIHALPGIEWARTPLEALRFARSRIAPSRTALAELAHAVESMPSMKLTGWYEASHLRRILRWLSGKPARVQTLASVCASLAGDRA